MPLSRQSDRTARIVPVRCAVSLYLSPQRRPVDLYLFRDQTLLHSHFQSRPDLIPLLLGKLSIAHLMLLLIAVKSRVKYYFNLPFSALLKSCTYFMNSSK